MLSEVGEFRDDQNIGSSIDLSVNTNTDSQCICVACGGGGCCIILTNSRRLT